MEITELKAPEALAAVKETVDRAALDKMLADETAAAKPRTTVLEEITKQKLSLQYDAGGKEGEDNANDGKDSGQGGGDNASDNPPVGLPANPAPAPVTPPPPPMQLPEMEPSNVGDIVFGEPSQPQPDKVVTNLFFVVTTRSLCSKKYSYLPKDIPAGTRLAVYRGPDKQARVPAGANYLFCTFDLNGFGDWFKVAMSNLAMSD